MEQFVAKKICKNGMVCSCQLPRPKKLLEIIQRTIKLASDVDAMAVARETPAQYKARKKEYAENLKLFKWWWEDVLAHATAETTKF